MAEKQSQNRTDKASKVLTYGFVGLLIVVVLIAVFLALTTPKKVEVPERPRPVRSVTTERDCDFIDLGELPVTVGCEDGTWWHANPFVRGGEPLTVPQSPE